MKKRVTLIIICYIILILIVTLLINLFKEEHSYNSKKINVIVTLYPEYDFVKKIGGEKVDVSRLIGAGVEVHTYEPSVKDMKKIADSDLFIYTGDSMEPWVKTITDSIDSKNIVNCSKNIELIEMDNFMKQYSILEESKENHEAEHNYEYDGHIWLNPQNAIIMVDTICEKLVEIDPENKNYYENNSEKYKEDLRKLDKEIEEGLKKANIDTLIFGGEFAYAYFCERYNLNVITAYSACGEGLDPSVSKIKEIIDYINSNSIDKVFYEELSEGTVAKMISEETEAKSVVFNTIHNVSQEEINNGENYISIMKENLERICK